MVSLGPKNRARPCMSHQLVPNQAPADLALSCLSSSIILWFPLHGLPQSMPFPGAGPLHMLLLLQGVASPPPFQANSCSSSRSWLSCSPLREVFPDIIIHLPAAATFFKNSNCRECYVHVCDGFINYPCPSLDLKGFPEKELDGFCPLGYLQGPAQSRP